MSTDYVALHVHGQRSELDGLARASDRVAAAVADGQVAQAITDHGTLADHWSFAAAATSAGITPILGLEAYVAIGSRHEQNALQIPAEEDFDGDAGMAGATTTKRYTHLTLLARNPAGWRNLVTGHNASQRSFWYKPRWDYELLAQHSSGLIIGTGCLGGPVAGPLLRGETDQARSALSALAEIVDPGCLFVEVMDHGLRQERAVIPGLVALAREFGLPVVATNDSHYVREDEAGAHDAWLAIGASARGGKAVLVTDRNRFRFNGTGYHMRTGAQMHALFDGQPGTETAVANSRMIAEMVERDVIPANGFRLPEFPTPGSTPTRELYERVKAGAIRRYGDPLPQAVKMRLRHELDVIGRAGFDSYLLIVDDLVDQARKRGIRVGPGRGSAAGSEALYSLGVTAVPPSPNGLLFSRFLDPDRPDMPDVDLDFAASRRDEMHAYLGQRYGADRVARIGSVQMSWARDAVRKIGRVSGASELADRIARAVPETAGKDVPLAAFLDPANQAGSSLRAILDGDPAARRLVDGAQSIEGVAAASGLHACGVVVGDEPLGSLIPLRRNNRDPDGPLVTEWGMEDLAAFGLVKLDLLAIKDLDVIETAADLVRATGTDCEPETASDDAEHPQAAAAYAMLAEGRTTGVFQLSSSGMAELARALRPREPEDVTALLALYRPGPMGAGMHHTYAARRRGAPVDYGVYTADPGEQAVIASVLDRSMGVVVYQEQLTELAAAIADFSPHESTTLRKAFSKKKKNVMDQVSVIWFERGMAPARRDGSPKAAFRRETLDRLWQVFASSASYLFNKSHSAAYGRLAFETAWLKANWPAQFGAALLTHTRTDDRRQAIMVSLRAEGIDVLAPDVNFSGVSTGVDPGGAVRLGLGEIKAVASVADWIVAEREQNGPFRSLADLAARVGVPNGTSGVGAPNATVLTALIESGACDHFGTRLGQAMIVRAITVPDLAVPDAEWPVVELAARQRDRLGVATGALPTAILAAQLREWRSPAGTPGTSVATVPRTAGATVHVIGMVRSVTVKSYSRGQFGTVLLEDGSGVVEVVFWGDRWTSLVNAGRAPTAGQIIGVTGVSTAPWTPPNSDESDDEAPPQMRGLSVWRGPLDDPVRRPSPAPAQMSPPTAPETREQTKPSPEPGSSPMSPPTAPERALAPVVPLFDSVVVGARPDMRLSHQFRTAWKELTTAYPGLVALDRSWTSMPPGQGIEVIPAASPGRPALQVKAAESTDVSTAQMLTA